MVGFCHGGNLPESRDGGGDAENGAEMEKRTKIAQTKVLDVRNSTKNAYFAACHDSRQNSVNCHETKKLCFRTLLWQCAVRPVL